jgi:hypothetical protein
VHIFISNAINYIINLKVKQVFKGKKTFIFILLNDLKWGQVFKVFDIRVPLNFYFFKVYLIILFDDEIVIVARNRAIRVH